MMMMSCSSIWYEVIIIIIMMMMPICSRISLFILYRKIFFSVSKSWVNDKYKVGKENEICFINYNTNNNNNDDDKKKWNEMKWKKSEILNFQFYPHNIERDGDRIIVKIAIFSHRVVKMTTKRFFRWFTHPVYILEKIVVERMLKNKNLLLMTIWLVQSLVFRFFCQIYVPGPLFLFFCFVLYLLPMAFIEISFSFLLLKILHYHCCGFLYFDFFQTIQTQANSCFFQIHPKHLNYKKKEKKSLLCSSLFTFRIIHLNLN